MKLTKLITLALSCSMTLAAEQKEATELTTGSQEAADLEATLWAREATTATLAEVDEDAGSEVDEDSSEEEELAEVDVKAEAADSEEASESDSEAESEDEEELAEVDEEADSEVSEEEEEDDSLA